MSKQKLKAHSPSFEDQQIDRALEIKDGLGRTFINPEFRRRPVSGIRCSNGQLFRTTLLAAFCLAAGTGFFSSVAAAEIIHFGFEEGPNPLNLDGPLNGMRVSGSPPVISRDFARSGSHSMKTQLNRLKSPTPYRMESTLNVGCNVFCFDSNKRAATRDYWIGFSVRMKAPYKRDKNLYPNQAIFQMHNAPPAGQGYPWWGNTQPLMIHAFPLNDTTGYFRVYAGGGGQTGLTQGDKLSVNVLIKDVSRYTTDKWVDFVIHAKFTSDSAGFLRIWIDGIQEINYSGPLDHVGNGPPYPKLGLYMGAWREANVDETDPVVERTLYHDDFKIAWGPGAGYDSVAPGNIPPSPLLAPSDLRVLEN